MQLKKAPLFSMQYLMLFCGLQVLDDNPLAEFVELPSSCTGLWYSNVLCGVIRAAMEQVTYQAKFCADTAQLSMHQKILLAT